MAGMNFGKILATLILDGDNGFMGVAFPNNGQTWLINAANKYPAQFRKAWNKHENNFIWVSYSWHPYRYLSIIAQSKGAPYSAPKLTYHPITDDEKHAYRFGRLTMQDIESMKYSPKPLGFKLLPPMLFGEGPTPKELKYLHEAYRQYKMTGVYDAEED
jgi:hypothetical protein